MTNSKLIEVGEMAPQFTLDDQDEKEVTLSALKGKKVLLSFHPLAWTGICADQMRSLEDNFSRFEELNTVPLGINIDSTPSKKAWSDSLKLEKLQMISDFWPHGGVAQKLGLFFDDKGFSMRANVIIDEEGKVIFVKVYEIGQLPDVEEVISFLASG